MRKTGRTPHPGREPAENIRGPAPGQRAGVAPLEFGVVVPTWNEAAGIAATVAHLRAFPEVRCVVVADAQSPDGTAARAGAAGALVIGAPRGRGPQMNAGARALRTAALAFVHADCRLPPGAFATMGGVLRSGAAAGTFAVRYPTRHPVLRVVGALSRFETALTSFGEGALFVRRDVFESAGAFPPWPLLEDVEMLRRLRRLGPVVKVPDRVAASPRRYLQHGVWRQQMHNGLVLLLFLLGVPPERLAARYEERRPAGGRPVSS
jgi:rSAM/selenodomain-associated transferase 2